MRRLFLLILMISLSATRSKAQSNIRVTEDAGIRTMMDHRKSLNFKKDRYVKAWSVQLITTRDKYTADQKKYEAQRRFRDLKIEWVYSEPYYKLNAGAFYTKIEASGLLNQVKDAFPGAYIFKNNQAKPTDF